jgi:hypothetical protein
MKNQLLCILILLIATALALPLVTGAYTLDDNPMSWKERLFAKSAERSFSTSGEYTGMIDGEIWLGGKTFSITNGTAIYVVGEGLLGQRISVTNSSVLLYGLEKNGVSKVKMVIVRPDDSTLRENLRKSKIPEGAIPSGVNPSTGMLSGGTPR